MPNPGKDPREDRRRWNAYIANGKNVTKAAAGLGLPRGTASSWLCSFKRELEAKGISEPTEAFWAGLGAEEPIVISGAAPAPEVIRMARLEQQVRTLRSQRDEALKAAVQAEDLRTSVFGLAEPIEPVRFSAPEAGPESGETVIVMLSDLHWGEVISLDAMDGMNSYNLQIARKRLERAFHAVADLSTRHWPGKPPERVILILGGDLISGDIHLELSKTNALSAIPSVRDLVGHLSAGIGVLLNTLDCPIDVISIPGNHGRSTLKPESKNAVETSYDILVADFLELQYISEKRVTFYTPASGDALFAIYGWQILCTHGDKIGSRGGHGFIGPAAVAARGMKKLVAEYAAIGTHLDLILMGHLHVALELEEGFVNASLAGPSEYGRMGRFRPKPATQLFLAIHPKRGVTQARRLQVGDPSEGSVYAPKRGGDARPRYRIKAIGRAA